MRISTTEFIISAKSIEQLPKIKRPEVAISGRSNVGKSSLINFILNKKGLAKTSSTPGKTKLLNYFLINEKFYFVDLPGYGYAKVSKSEQDEWRKFIEDYFQQSENLKLVLQLIDIRHELKDIDRQMIQYFEYYGIPYIILLTKTDKLKQNDKIKQLNYFKGLFPGEVIATSAEKNLGKDEVLKSIAGYLK